MKNQRGVALFTALVGILLMVVLAVEFSKEAIIEYRSASNAVHRLQAYYAAKAGVELSLLRIKLFKSAMAKVGDSLGDQKSLLDQIWQMPFQWPPELPVEASKSLEDQIQETTKQSLMKSSYVTVIEPEGQKINLPLVLSPSQKISDFIKEQLFRVFSGKLENDPGFQDRYDENSIRTLIHNIIDWMDEDDVSLNGGAESNYYEGKEPSLWPPQRIFYSLGEMRLVAGMNEELFSILKDQVTLYGVQGVEINFLSKEVFLSLHPEMTEETYEDFELYKEQNGHFIDLESFLSFLEDQGFELEELKASNLPLIFDSPANFRIYSTGISRNFSQSIEAVVVDKDSLKRQFIKGFKAHYLKEEKTKKKTSSTSSGNSTIVYWRED